MGLFERVLYKKDGRICEYAAVCWFGVLWRCREDWMVLQFRFAYYDYCEVWWFRIFVWRFYSRGGFTFLQLWWFLLRREEGVLQPWGVSTAVVLSRLSSRGGFCFSCVEEVPGERGGAGCADGVSCRESVVCEG